MECTVGVYIGLESDNRKSAIARHPRGPWHCYPETPKPGLLERDTARCCPLGVHLKDLQLRLDAVRGSRAIAATPSPSHAVWIICQTVRCFCVCLESLGFSASRSISRQLTMVIRPRPMSAVFEFRQALKFSDFSIVESSCFWTWILNAFEIEFSRVFWIFKWLNLWSLESLNPRISSESNLWISGSPGLWIFRFLRLFQSLTLWNFQSSNLFFFFCFFFFWFFKSLNVRISESFKLPFLDLFKSSNSRFSEFSNRLIANFKVWEWKQI